MKLQGKTAAGILGVFVTLGCCAAIVTSRWESDHAIKGAENRVRLYIKAAWEIYNSKLERIQAAIAILAVDPRLKAFLRGRVDDPQRARALQQEMTGMRQAQGMDILNILDAQGRVVMRSRPPFAAGDSLAADPLVERVLSTGKASTGTLILSPQRLVKEGDGLIETCRSAGGGEQGMMTAAAMPVVASGEIVGIVLMGNLLNGAVDKVDRIRNSVFEGERYQGRPVGTATIFMGNLRISTNVLDEHGRRAVGTRASAEVAERVIEQGRSWNGRAWVVNAWYLSQYDPIHDPQGRVIGMLYMGTLEQLYLDQRRRAVVINVAVILGGMLLAMAVFFMLMRNILSPVRKLSLATQRVAGGDLGQRVEVRSRDEIGDLSASFNSMAEQLRRDQEEIQRSQAALAERNEELRTINRHYMEMLGFVSHELKAPLGSAILSLYSVKDGYLGALNEGQVRALKGVAQSLDYLNDMIKHYLDLSRLEKGELNVRKDWVALRAEVIDPLLETLDAAMAEKSLGVENRVAASLRVHADRDLIKIVYENLLSNAVKYGRESGQLRLGAALDAGAIRLHVENDGEGIARDKIERLFKKFSRLTGEEETGRKGTGLGLFICKAIIEAHGGRMGVESEEGRWTRFSFTLPLQAAEASQDRKSDDDAKEKDTDH